MGYKNTLPLSKYAAAVLASNSVSPNRRSKIFLNMRSLSAVNRGLESQTYGERWMKGCHIEPHRTLSAMYLSEAVTISPQSQHLNWYVRPNDIAELEHLSHFEPSLIRHLLNGLSLSHADNRSLLRFRAKL